MGYLAPAGDRAVCPAPVTGAGLRDTRVFCASYFADLLQFILVPSSMARISNPLLISSSMTFSTEFCNAAPNTWDMRPSIRGWRLTESGSGGTPFGSGSVGCGARCSALGGGSLAWGVAGLALFFDRREYPG